MLNPLLKPPKSNLTSRSGIIDFFEGKSNDYIEKWENMISLNAVNWEKYAKAYDMSVDDFKRDILKVIQDERKARHF